MAHVQHAWKEGHKHKADPAWFGQELDKIAERDGQVTPDSVVELGRPKKSPIHTYFEWDNEEAGDRYRKWQARQLMSHLIVVSVGKDEARAPIRAFVNLSPFASKDDDGDDDESPRAYYPIVSVLSDPIRRAQLLAQARGELAMWRKKYADLNEFAGLIPVIQEYLDAAE